MHRTWILGLAPLVLLALSACGGGQPSTQTGQQGTGTPDGEAPLDLTSLPAWTKNGNTYFFPTQSNPPTLDPAQISDTTSDAVCNQLFDTLLTLDDDLNVAPEIATAWTIDPDNITYHFTLTDKAKFHNGRTVVADDVKYTIKRILNPDVASKRSNWALPIKGAQAFFDRKAEDVEGIIVKSPTELTLVLEKPFAPFIFHLTQQTFAIIPREHVEQVGDDKFTLNPMGSGPFKFVDWKQNQYILLEANKDYWQGAPQLDGIIYKVIKEPRQQYEEYRRGNLHHCWVEPVNVQPLVANDEEMQKQMHTYPLASLLYYGFNMLKEPFGVPPEKQNDPEAHRKAKLLRYAANYAIDKDYIVNDIIKKQGVPYNKIIPPGLGDYRNPTDTPDFQYNPTKAAELLKEAGYPNGEGLPPITLWFNKEGSHPDVAAAAQNDLKKVGITVDTRTMEWASYLEAVNAGEPQMYRLGWVQDYPDPDNWLWILFHSANHGPLGNNSFYTNPEVDKLLDQAQVSTDHAERMRLYQRAESIILNDAVWIPIWHGINYLLVKPEVKGMHFTAMDSADTIQHVRFEKVSFQK